MKFIRKAKRTTKSSPNKSHIPFRLNVLFFVVFLLFAALVAQLANLQIDNGKKYLNEVDSGTTTTETGSVQRGQIYDSTGKLLAGTKANRAITYTKPYSVTTSTMYNVANRLAKYVTVSTSSLTTAAKVEYYLANSSNLTKVENALKKQYSGFDNFSTSKQYSLESDYVIKNNLASNLTSQQKSAAMMFYKMSSAYSLSTVYLKSNGVTDAEMTNVAENLSSLAGVKIGSSWSRSYPNGSSVSDLTGSISSGLPSDTVNTYLAMGYSSNDNVGVSGVESQYENVLKGTNSITKVITSNGEITKEIKQYGGSNGDNVQLTVNGTLQTKVQSLIKSSLSSVSSSNPYVAGAYAIVMDPNTGAILAMGGASRNISTGKISDNILGVINNSFVMGSVVKPATVMGAMLDGVITPTSSTLTDQPIKLAGTAAKTSWFNTSGNANMSLTASDALMVSSNSYMMQLAMKEGHFNYSSGKALTMSNSVFSTLRTYFNMFGLGVKTGVDLSGESSGYQGSSSQANIGKALDLSFGNYDAYTVLQLGQYVSTVANGGYRLTPHILQSIRGTNADGSLGAVKYEYTPRVLNTIPATSAQWDVVHNGMWKVVHGTSSYRTGGTLSTVSPAVAAKTGTAQTFYNNNQTYTLSAVTYAPYKNPKVIVAIAFPGMSNESDKTSQQDVIQIYKWYWKYVNGQS